MSDQEWLSESNIVDGKLRVTINPKYPKPFFYCIAKQITPDPDKEEKGMTVSRGGFYKDETYRLARDHLSPSDVMITKKGKFSTVHIAGKKQKFASAFVDANPEGEVKVYEDEHFSEINSKKFII